MLTIELYSFVVKNLCHLLEDLPMDMVVVHKSVDLLLYSCVVNWRLHYTVLIGFVLL